VRIPDFFIVGAPKCGTTAMYRWLAAHPEVFVPVKEIHYFGSDLAHRRPPVSEERYRALFADAVAAHRAVGDVAVWYLMSESAVEEIHAFNPDARIIVMLRRPDDMLYSLHSQLLYSGEEDLLDFGAALDAESERAQGRSIPESTHRGLEAPPTECLLYSRVASLVNPNTKAKSQLARTLIQGVWFGPLRSLVPVGLRGMGRRGLESLQALNTQISPRPPMDEHLRQRVQAQLGPDIERLASLIGRDLSSWMMD
jgi:hypothetical protein